MPPLHLTFAVQSYIIIGDEGTRGHNRVNQLQKQGFPLIGVMFLALGAFKLIQGDDWVVWIIIGILFGGLGAISRRKNKQP